MSDDPTPADRWESAAQLATDEQYEWIREHCGEEAANLANYGWATDRTEEPLVVGVATRCTGTASSRRWYGRARRASR
jgi:hypothetical protein